MFHIVKKTGKVRTTNGAQSEPLERSGGLNLALTPFAPLHCRLSIARTRVCYQLLLCSALSFMTRGSPTQGGNEHATYHLE